MIGHAKERNGLYLLEESCTSVLEENKSYSFMLESQLTKKEKILLFHYQLGHPSFKIIKVMFLSLFYGIKNECLQCDLCEIAKHHNKMALQKEKKGTW